jgi:hypothetical protein
MIRFQNTDDIFALILIDFSLSIFILHSRDSQYDFPLQHPSCWMSANISSLFLSYTALSLDHTQVRRTRCRVVSLFSYPLLGVPTCAHTNHKLTGYSHHKQPLRHSRNFQTFSILSINSNLAAEAQNLQSPVQILLLV